MERLEQFITSLEKENYGHRRSALINNMYYHIFSNGLVEYIGKRNIAKQLKSFEKQGEDVLFWKAQLVNIKIIPDKIAKLKSKITDLDYFIENDNCDDLIYKDMWTKYCLMATYPHLFLCYPLEFCRNELIQSIKDNHNNILTNTGNDTYDLLELMCGEKQLKEARISSFNSEKVQDELWTKYINNKSPKKLIEIFYDIVDKLDKINCNLVLFELENYLIADTKCYREYMIDLHKRLCDKLDSNKKNVIEEWRKYYSDTDFRVRFDAFFCDMDNIYSIWKNEHSEIENILNKLGETEYKSPIVNVFYDYMCSRPSDNYTSYDYKQLVKNLEEVQSLIELKYIPINKKDHFGETLLMNAVRWRQDSVVVYLCANGANPNIQNNYGKTALHMTCGKLHKNKWSYVPLLLSYGADPTIKCNSGKTPFKYALQNHAFSTINALARTNWKRNVRSELCSLFNIN